MVSRSTVFVWIGILCLSGMFLAGQDTWEPQQKIVFITEAASNGDMGGLVGADVICQEEATAAGLTGAFKAWLSDSTGSSPLNRFTHPAAPYVLVDLTQVAASWADLTDGTLDHAINLTSTGGTLGAGEFVATATFADGAYDWIGFVCNDWTDGTGSNWTSTGNYNSTTDFWTHDGGETCDSPLHLYCFQQ